jgi:hypothetical protein
LRVVDGSRIFLTSRLQGGVRVPPVVRKDILGSKRKHFTKWVCKIEEKLVHIITLN